MSSSEPLSPFLREQFAHALGPKGFLEDPSDIAPWLKDWRGVYEGRASAILAPANAKEVQAVVRLASEHNIPLVPQGGNTSMVGGATPPLDGGALILSMRRMNKIRSIESDAGIVIAEAGVILSNLHDAASAVGQRFPLTLGAKGSATIGGLVSTNAGGTQVLRFGTMRKLVLGVEAVLPDGALFNGLTVLKKDNRGYDLSQLLIGAEGTIGIVTAASLRLFPAAHDRAVGWMGVETPQMALSLLRAMEAQSGDAIESFEIIPDASLSLVLQHIPNTRAPLSGRHPWHVLVEYAVTKESGKTAQSLLTDLIAGQIDANCVRDAVVALNEAQALAFWHLRDSISEAERASGPAMQHDISVPISAMPDFMISAAAQVEARFPGVTASAFGHLGDGNVHFHVRAPQGGEGEEWRKTVGYAASQFVYDLVSAAGGSLSAEHGIGQMKLAELVRQSDSTRLNALRAIKNAFDPKGIMNPGKLVPLASARAAP
ncbi:MAG: FAD-binding oxidoreductase [Chakrabartia sp.]